MHVKEIVESFFLKKQTTTVATLAIRDYVSKKVLSSTNLKAFYKQKIPAAK